MPAEPFVLQPPPVAPNVTTLRLPEPEPGRVRRLVTAVKEKRRYAFVFGVAVGVATLETAQLAAMELHSAATPHLNRAKERLAQSLPSVTNLTNLSGLGSYEQISRLLPKQTWLGAEFGISYEEMLEMLPVEQQSWRFGWLGGASRERA